MCRALADIFPVDLEEIGSRIGKDSIYDYRITHSGNPQPFSPGMLGRISERICDICTQIEKNPLKCLVLDLDDTLWGGIVGEEGFEYIALGDDGIGKVYKDFQRYIVKLYKQGVILAICSKNNTCDALEVIEQHPHMLIRPEMISCYRINWDDKPGNLKSIADELNIGLDSIMFVDNSKTERELIRSTLPQVEILELPENAAEFRNTLEKCTRFWPLTLTKEDAYKGTLSFK